MMNNNDLTQGNIYKKLFKLALPIMGTSFVQMAYNMIDMIWVGKLGSSAVAAVGTAGFFTWLAMTFIIIPKISAEIGVAQSVGKGNMDEGRVYIRHSIQLVIIFALFYGLGLILFRNNLVSFFNLGDAKIESDTSLYLLIVSIGFIFYFLNPVFSAVFNGSGDSKTPFMINSVGLIVNIILDPILILGLGPIPRMEVAGAALATIISQAIVTAIFIYKMKDYKALFGGIKLFKPLDLVYTKKIIKLGLPVAVQSGFFTIIAMVMARIIAQWGTTPIAVQKIGSQIESISWMTVGGFETAMSAFTGQNYGANKMKRVAKGYFAGISIASMIGIMATGLLIFAARPIFSIFIQEEQAILYGVDYLQILGVSQLFMCIEITTTGAFNGLGKTIPPSIIGIVFNAARIPLAIILSRTSLGLNGVWWAISISSIFKGILLCGWYLKAQYAGRDSAFMHRKSA